ncbi:hypothetical protein [Achromobacter sp.]|uniref:hypothetical protein n=1 Tax=Achromobacter sp. TaxID=134375 RepID=UPI0028AA395E|nr:hypothetical protein [Achromobacter sp.]
MNWFYTSGVTPQPGKDNGPPAQHPAEMPPSKPKRDDRPERDGGKEAPWPPDSIPNPMPGVDPQQTPGIDRLGPQAITPTTHCASTADLRFQNLKPIPARASPL